jgi:NADPH:quinone reductase-like Zn-dependent oxidoreductase
MKAVYFNSHGNPEVLKYGDVEEPKLNKGDAIIEIKYSSINRLDLLIRRGYPGINIPLPHIPGVDIYGKVIDIDDNNEINPGDYVVANTVYGCGNCDFCLSGKENMCYTWKMIGFHINGSHAEFVKVPSKTLLKVKGDGEKLGVSPLSLSVAWNAMVTVGKVKRDDFVLIYGGSGGVGTFAIQVAKLFKAKSIVTTRSDEKAKILRSIGADYVINSSDEDILNKIMEITDRKGVDIIIDYIVNPTMQVSLDAAKINGKIIVFGFLGGNMFPINWQKFYLKNLRIYGIHNASKLELKNAIKYVENNEIEPYISKTLRLEEVIDGHRIMENNEIIGKLLVKID